MRLYHVTSDANAASIRAGGFIDRERVLGTDDQGREFVVRGVWFSDGLWEEGGYADDVPEGHTALAVEMPHAVVNQWEVVNEGAGYREWCIPAAAVNLYPAVALPAGTRVRIPNGREE